MEARDLEPLPIFRSDEEAELFVETADLSEYDLSGGRPMQFEFAAKTARVNMRLPQAQLTAAKAEAARRGLPYQRPIRDLIDRGLEDLRRA